MQQSLKLIYRIFFDFFSKEIVQLLLVIILGVVLRLINLGQQPYWGDEAFAAGVLRHYSSLGDLIQYVGLIEYYPPLSYIFLHFWSSVFGDSILSMRFPSMIAGVFVIWMTYLFGQAMFRGRRVGLYAALIVAVLPIQIHFSQSIRPYIMIALFGLLATLAYARYHNEQRLFFLMIYVISSVLGVYLSYSFIFILFPLMAFWLLSIILRDYKDTHVRSFVIWLSAHAVIFLSFYPWLKFLLYKLIFNRYELFELTAPVALIYRSASFFSMNLDQLIWMTKDVQISQIEVLAIWLVKLVSMYFAIHLFLTKTDQIRRLFLDNALTIYLLIWMIVVPLTMYLFSWSSVIYTQVEQQHMILVSIMIAILFALLIDQVIIKQRLLLISLLLISLLTITINVVGDDSVWDTQYRLRDVAAFINDGYHKGDIVITGYDILRTDINYFLRTELSAIGFYPTTYYGIDYFNSRDTMGLVEIEFHFRMGQPTRSMFFTRMDRLVDINKPKRIWFAYFHWPELLENWAKERGWYKVFSSPYKKLLPLEMYAESSETK